MEKVLAYLQNRLWEIALILAFFLIYFLPWRFLTNDDEVMRWLVSGAYTGKPESFAVFIHPALSALFASVYGQVPGVDWYPITWFGVMLASGCYLFHLTRKYMGQGLRSLVWNLILFALLIHFAFFLHFSLVAAFATMGGLLTRIFRFQKGDISPFRLLSSDLFLLVAFLIRPEVPLLLGFGVMGLYFLIDGLQSAGRMLLIPMLGLLIFMGMTVGMIYGLGYGEFWSHNRLRSQVFDHPSLQLDKGFWKNAEPELFYFSNGLQDFSSGKLEKEVLKHWKDQLDEHRSSLVRPDFIPHAWWTFLDKHYFFSAILGILLVFGIWIAPRKSVLALGILLIGMVFLSFFYLIKVQLFALIAMSFAVYILPNHKKEKQAWIYAFLSIFLFFLIGIHFYSFFKSKENIQVEGGLISLFRQVENQSQQKVIWVGETALYPELQNQHPLKFKLLGWSSLLEKYQDNSIDSTTYFLVHANTFASNRGYFGNVEVDSSLVKDFVLIHRK